MGACSSCAHEGMPGGELVRRTEGAGWGSTRVLARVPGEGTPPLAESDSIPAIATFTAPRAGIWAKSDDGEPLGLSPSWWGEFTKVWPSVLYHHEGPLVLVAPPSWFT